MAKAKPKKPQPARSNVKVRYFPTTPHVTEEIEAWAAQADVRILAIVPIYMQDVRG